MRQVTKLAKKPRPLVGIGIEVCKHRHPPNRRFHINAARTARPVTDRLSDLAAQPPAFNPILLFESGCDCNTPPWSGAIAPQGIATDRRRLSKVTSAIAAKRTP